jgi:hypothetical protein
MSNAFEIQKYDNVDCYPVSGSSDPASLVAMPQSYKAKFVPRNKSSLAEAIEDLKVVDGQWAIVEGVSRRWHCLVQTVMSPKGYPAMELRGMYEKMLRVSFQQVVSFHFLVSDDL